jgi:protein SCO1
MMLRALLCLLLLAAPSALRADGRITAPNVPVIDQNGQRVAFPALIRGRTAVIAFLFTGCSSSCPVIGRRLAEVKSQLGSRVGKDVVLIAVSVDPMGDTPVRMAKFSRDVGLAGAGWHFVSGGLPELTRLRETLAGGGPGMGHTNSLLVINDRAGTSTRLDAAVLPSRDITRRVIAAAEVGLTRKQATARYFGTGALVSERGRPVDFYRDVLAGRVVVISTMFTRCTDACPLIVEKLAKTRSLLGPVASRVTFVSISNDPAYDNPQRLRQFAMARGATGNWNLLTGPEANVRPLLAKLNLGGTTPGDHSTALIIGNDASGSWRRVSPAISPPELAKLLRQVAAEATAS